MEDQFRIRNLSQLDTSSVAAIYERVCRSSQFPIGLTWTTAQVREECEVGVGLILERVNGSGFEIGSFILFRDQGTANEVTFLGSDPDFQKRGWMRQLLRTMQSLPKEIWLEVHENNLAARGLYASMGFEEVGTRVGYYPDGAAAILYNFGAKSA